MKNNQIINLLIRNNKALRDARDNLNPKRTPIAVQTCNLQLEENSKKMKQLGKNLKG